MGMALWGSVPQTSEEVELMEARFQIEELENVSFGYGRGGEGMGATLQKEIRFCLKNQDRIRKGAFYRQTLSDHLHCLPTENEDQRT